jgi:3-deoxy-D-manno-octulosonic acid kinase
MEAVGGLVGRAHRAGLDHPDLNVGNLFLEPADPGWRAWLLDLDRATIGPPSPDSTRRNLARLVRSLEKERRRGGIAWDEADLDAFLGAHRAELDRT